MPKKKTEIEDFEDFEEPKETEPEDEPKVPVHFNSQYIHQPGKPTKFHPHDTNGKLRLLMVDVRIEEDSIAGSQLALGTLPVGKFRLLGILSNLFSSFSTKVDIGWLAHKVAFSGFSPTVVNGLDTGISLKAGVPIQIGGNQPASSKAFESMEGVTLFATCHSPVKKGDVLNGFLIYVQS